MKAAVYHGRHDLRVEEVPKPACGDSDVLIRIAYCGVCGTDHHIYHGDGGMTDVPPGTIIGHEFSGVVEQIGSQVRDIRAGDHVSVDPNDWCGACSFCLAGKAHFCKHMKGYGTTFPGGFAEYAAVPASQVHRLPESLDLRIASQCETLSCCLNGIDLCHIRAGDEVLVIGGGPIGLMMLQLARLAGAGKLILSELSESKRALALKLGAEVAVDPGSEDLAEVLRKHTQNVDCVIEAAGTAATQSQAIELAGRGATVMLFGLVAPGTEISIKPFDIFRKELKLTSSFINPYTFDRAIRLLAGGRISLDDLITDVVPLEDIQKVFADNAYRSRGKVLVRL